MFGTEYAALLVHENGMIQKVRIGFENVDALIGFVNSGCLLLHTEDSGIYLMLAQCIKSHLQDKLHDERLQHLMYSINDDNPIFHKTISRFQIQNLPALLIIKNGEVINVVNGPITKIELLKNFSSFENWEKLNFT